MAPLPQVSPSVNENPNHVLNLQTDNTHKARVSIFAHIPTSYTYTNLYIFVPVHASIRCNSFSCCSEYNYFAQNIRVHDTRYVRMPMPQNTTNPTHHSRKGLWPDLQDAMTVAFC